ncbi:MAG TPA: hypothetical protein VK459_06075, partial [Polyangiaceae bacterium]|nr:hypothetical protein [Polyangiaceae bacterium]
MGALVRGADASLLEGPRIEGPRRAAYPVLSLGVTPPVPTLAHNGPIEMFRENPSLAPHLLARLFAIDVPAHASVRVADSSLDQLIPVEFRADLVLELRDDKDAVVLSIVLESQRDVDARKKFSWPVYVTVARAERESATVVLVIAIDAETAAWAGEKIDLGLGLGTIQPLVLGPATLPIVTDPTVAEKEVEVAVLSAMAHGNGPQGLAVLQAAFGALGRLDHEHAAVYFQIIWNMLREPMRRALETMVMEGQTEGKATFPPFAQQLIDRGKLEGLREGELKGLREGELKGLREGELKGLRDALLRLIARA